jgi:hypothetical protein
MQLEATHLRGNRWAVKPVDQLGTCGSFPKLWTVQYINARTAAEAVAKARK